MPYDTNQQKVIPLNQVEIGKNYAVVITTNAGLWRYIIGDTVRFTNLSPYRIKITGRTKHHINVFGEELIIENAEEALRIAARVQEAEIVDYTAGPVFMEGKTKGRISGLSSLKHRLKTSKSLVKFSTRLYKILTRITKPNALETSP